MERETNENCVQLRRNTDRMLDRLYNQYQERKLVDISFICGPQQENVTAHRLILSLFTSLFEPYNSPGQNKEPITVLLSNVDKNILLYILELLYRGTVNVPEDKLSTFYNVLEKFNMNDLILRQTENPVRSPEVQQVILKNKFAYFRIL